MNDAITVKLVIICRHRHTGTSVISCLPQSIFCAVYLHKDMYTYTYTYTIQVCVDYFQVQAVITIHTMVGKIPIQQSLSDIKSCTNHQEQYITNSVQAYHNTCSHWPQQSNLTRNQTYVDVSEAVGQISVLVFQAAHQQQRGFTSKIFCY